MLYLIIILAFVGGFFLVRTRYVDLIVRVSAPKYVNQAPCIIGELPLLGNWKDHSHKMTLGEDGRFETKLRVQANTHVEFKFTLGSWELVEKGKRFNEIPNRKIIANRSHTSEFEIANFAGFEDESPNHTRKGKFEYIRNFASKHLENNRNILIYLPPSYKSNSSRKYPVLYMHDGNNLFDANTAFMGVEWEVDEAAERLIEMDLLQEIIDSFKETSSKQIDLIVNNDENKIAIRRTPEIIYGLRNFIGNAVKFSKSKVKITLKSNKKIIEIKINDDGPGIPEDIIEKIGEPYIKSQSIDLNSNSGLGLGSFLGKTLLERKGAKLAFRRNSDLGGALVILTWSSNSFTNS